MGPRSARKSATKKMDKNEIKNMMEKFDVIMDEYVNEGSNLESLMALEDMLERKGARSASPPSVRFTGPKSSKKRRMSFGRRKSRRSSKRSMRKRSHRKRR
jgi:hypothetical protein